MTDREWVSDNMDEIEAQVRYLRHAAERGFITNGDAARLHRAMKEISAVADEVRDRRAWPAMAQAKARR